jgi:hypothetical protein
VKLGRCLVLPKEVKCISFGSEAKSHSTRAPNFFCNLESNFSKSQSLVEIHPDFFSNILVKSFNDMHMQEPTVTPEEFLPACGIGEFRELRDRAVD